MRSCYSFSSVQLLSSVWLFATPWTTARQASLSITNSQSPSKPMSVESVMPSNHLILCRPLLLLPSIFPSIRVFSNEAALHIRWPKYWSFSFNISPTNEHPGQISFRMDWLDLLAVQRTLRSLHQLMCEWMKSLSRVQLFATPWTVAHPVPLSMGFSKQEYWIGLPFPSPWESSRPRDRTLVSRVAGRCFNLWATSVYVPQLEH